MPSPPFKLRWLLPSVLVLGVGAAALMTSAFSFVGELRMGVGPYVSPGEAEATMRAGLLRDMAGRAATNLDGEAPGYLNDLAMRLAESRATPERVEALQDALRCGPGSGALLSAINGLRLTGDFRLEVRLDACRSGGLPLRLTLAPSWPPVPGWSLEALAFEDEAAFMP